MRLLAIAKAIWGPPKDWDWHPQRPFKKVMRRKVGDRWEERAATEQDETAYVESDVWRL